MKIGREHSREEGDSIFRAAAKALKKHSPALHEFLKQAFRRSKLPSLKRINGKLLLTAPELISVQPTEPHVLAWIDELLRPGDTFLDVGAHYGWMSLLACHCVGSRGKVVAFEPSPPLVEFLRYHKKVNRFRQMEIVPKAVADSDHRLVPFHLVDLGNGFLNSLVDHRIELATTTSKQNATIQVETITLDEFCKTANVYPNAVKVDVEGAELLALQGSRALLKEGRAAFIVAVHPTWFPLGQNAAELFDLFRLHGYQIAASQVVPYEGADFGDYLFFPPNTQAS
jgi:FkbM family methyltransferase